MKVYINYGNLSIIKIEREKPFYQGSNFIDRIRILFDKTEEDFSPTAMFKLPTGRRIGPVYPVGLDNGTTRLINENGESWYYYDFIISTELGLLTHPGQLEASFVLNYYNTAGVIIKQAVVGTIVNEVVKTTVYGEGTIIIIGENPETILANVNSNMEILANRQTSLETVWSNQLSKLVPVIKNYLNDSKDTRIEFWDDEIKIIHAGRLIATFSNEAGLIVSGNLEGTDLSLSGDIFANSPTAQARFNQLDFKDGTGENLDVDDIRALDGHIEDSFYVKNEIHLDKIEVKSSINAIKSNLNRLLNIIQDNLDEGTAKIYFSDNSIEIRHNGNSLMRLSADDGIAFYEVAEFKKDIEVRTDIFLKGESLVFTLKELKDNFEEAKTYAYRKVEQEIKDRNAAIEDLKNKLIDGAPQALDTLLELSKALGDDPNFATTITNLINQKYAESKKFTEDNFARKDEIYSMLNFTETDLAEVFEGVYAQ